MGNENREMPSRYERRSVWVAISTGMRLNVVQVMYRDWSLWQIRNVYVESSI